MINYSIKSFLLQISRPIILTGFIVGLPVSAAFGDVDRIAVHNALSIKSGWVIVDKTKGSDGLTYSGDDYFVIKDLNGAPYATTAMTLRESNIPSGWFITDTDAINSSNPNQVPKIYTITNLNGAPYGTMVRLVRVPGVPVPAGWSVIPKPSPSVAEPMGSNSSAIVKAPVNEGTYIWYKRF